MTKINKNILLKMIGETGNGGTLPYALARRTASVVFRTEKNKILHTSTLHTTHTLTLHTLQGDTYVNVAHPKKGQNQCKPNRGKGLNENGRFREDGYVYVCVNMYYHAPMKKTRAALRV